VVVTHDFKGSIDTLAPLLVVLCPDTHHGIDVITADDLVILFEKRLAVLVDDRRPAGIAGPQIVHIKPFVLDRLILVAVTVAETVIAHGWPLIAPLGIHGVVNGAVDGAMILLAVRPVVRINEKFRAVLRFSLLVELVFREKMRIRDPDILQIHFDIAATRVFLRSICHF
jgi:hypothetical protein